MLRYEENNRQSQKPVRRKENRIKLARIIGANEAKFTQEISVFPTVYISYKT